MGSAVVFFMKRHVHWIAAGVSLPPIVFRSFASFAVVVLGPLMARLWSGLAARGLEPTEVQKMAIGLGLLSLSYLLLSSVALDLGPSGLGGPAIHLLCVGFYLLHTGGLVIVVPAGLAFLTRWAPVRWVGPADRAVVPVGGRGCVRRGVVDGHPGRASRAGAALRGVLRWAAGRRSRAGPDESRHRRPRQRESGGRGRVARARVSLHPSMGVPAMARWLAI